MVVKHNLTAMNANRMLGITTKSQASATEKLSSGYKVNRAADDAAGLSISEKMRKQIRGLTQASTNAQDGISMVQTADGALEEVHAMLQRGNELAVKAANGTLSEDDRRYIDNEIQQLHTEIDRVRSTSKFNETYLFPEKKMITASSPMVSSELNLHLEYDSTTKLYSIENAYEGDKVIFTDGSGNVTESTILAERIANEFVPNAIKQIFDAYPALDDDAKISMDLKIMHIDGKNGVLAQAVCGISSSGGTFNATNFKIQVDEEDFSDEDALGTGPLAGRIESAIAHELTHTVMFHMYPKGMVGEADASSHGLTADDVFPLWFIEGAAQMSGGGFTANWNEWLRNETKTLASENDTTHDTAIKNKLMTSGYDPQTQVYGTGYILTAMIAHRANVNKGGGSEITSENLAKGMNYIFEELNAGRSLSVAVANVTGESLASFLSEFNDLATNAEPIPAAVDFARRLGYAVGAAGSGSAIAPSLSTGGTALLANTAGQQDYYVAGTYSIDTGLPAEMGSLNLHVGADTTSNNQINVKLFNIGAAALGLGTVDFSTQDTARMAIDNYANAIQRVSSIRSYYGAIQNRLEHTIKNLDNVVENTTSAESSIRDTDMALQMVAYSNNNILLQAGQAMLAQANQSQDGIMALLR